MPKTFKIPEILWTEILESTNDTTHKRWDTVNTFIKYTIQEDQGHLYCYYGNGRFKEFHSLEDVKNWVKHIHYPSQVKKYFVEVEG